MFTIAHFSDLRFGAITSGMAEALLADVAKVGAGLVVVSGNLSRRGSADQFREARKFLDRLSTPWVAVPGARDTQPLNLIDRFFRPLHAWRAGISHDLSPFFENPEVAVLGIDTSRASLGKKISVAQAGAIRSKLGSANRVTVLVSHHPLVPRPASGATTTVMRPATQDLHVVSKCVDVVLAGHQTVGSTQDTRVAYRVLDRSTIVAQALNTPSSSSGRDAIPYYNAVRIDGEKIGFAVRLWRGAEFEEQGAKSYRFNGTIWDKFVDMPPDFQWTDSGDVVQASG